MAKPIIVDAHAHIYRSAADGRAEKEGYQIWEYGTQDSVQMSALDGTVEEILEAMTTAEMSHAIAVNLFVAAEHRAKRVAALPEQMTGEARSQALRDIEAAVLEDMKDFNRWGCQVARDHPQIATFLATDVTLLAGDRAADHVREMVEGEGAKGVKLHGAACGFAMGDERLWPVYAACQDLGIPIIAHAGPDRGGKGFAEPRAFAAALEAFPDLTIVLAHMGGATWDQALEIAERFPNAAFDCCEIIEWTRSTNGPTAEQLARLIQDVGSERVMMGSDYPWYDLDQSVESVMALPLLSSEEKETILGANAVRILGL